MPPIHRNLDFVAIMQLALACVLILSVMWRASRQGDLFASRARFIGRNLGILLAFAASGLAYAYAIFRYSRDFLFAGALLALLSAALTIWGGKGMIHPNMK